MKKLILSTTLLITLFGFNSFAQQDNNRGQRGGNQGGGQQGGGQRGGGGGGQRPPQNNGGQRPPQNNGGQRPPQNNGGGQRPPPQNHGGQRPPQNNGGGQRPPPQHNPPPQYNGGGQRPPPPSNNGGRYNGGYRQGGQGWQPHNPRPIYTPRWSAPPQGYRAPAGQIWWNNGWYRAPYPRYAFNTIVWGSLAGVLLYYNYYVPPSYGWACVASQNGTVVGIGHGVNATEAQQVALLNCDNGGYNCSYNYYDMDCSPR